MQIMKYVTAFLLLIPINILSNINFDLAIFHKSAINIAQAVELSVGQPAKKVYQDNTTYIEAELVSEQDQMPLVRLYYATKNDAGMFVIRGVPQISTSLVQGLGIASIQCDFPGETFMLVVAMSKV